MRTGKVIVINNTYELYHPDGQLLATTNTLAGIKHTVKRYGLTGYIISHQETLNA
jgi:hypothetical protein